MSTKQKCEMQDCNSIATEYVMDKGSGGWAGYACAIHAEQFPIREPLKGEPKMARPVEPTSEAADSERNYEVPVHNSITGYADVVVRTTVHFDSIEVMDAFCNWVTDQYRGDTVSVVRDFIHAAENARNEAERIRENLR